MGKKTGAAIKAARTAAGLTQEQLAKKIKGISASDISNAERGETDLTQAVLKEIAKATGVTQATLLNAEKAGGKSGTGKTAGKTGTGKSSSSSASSAKSEMMLTKSERELVSLYRKADASTKEQVMQILSTKKKAEELVSGLIGGALSSLLSGGKKTSDKE